MLYMMTDEEKRNRINKGVRWISNFIFKGNINNVGYASAYGKLHSRFLLDYGYSLSDRTESPKTKDKSIFDIVSSEELEMLLQSLYRLEKMYNEVMDNKCNVGSLKKRKEICYG